MLFANETISPTRSANFCISMRSPRREDLTFLLLKIPIPILSIVLNGIVLLAAGLQRKTLRRHNYVFSSVCSTLVSNMVHTVLTVWTVVADYFQFMADGVTDVQLDVKEMSEKWWVARSAMILSLLLAMCGNIGSLIFVLMDSTYFVGRKIDHGQLIKTSFWTWDEISGRYRIHVTKRAKCRFLIAISWLAPMVLVVISTTSGWNCKDDCCPPGYYQVDSCPVEKGCSRMWPPLTHSFLAIILAVWIVEVILMVWLLLHTSMRFRQIALEREQMSNSESEPNSGTRSDQPKVLTPRESITPTQYRDSIIPPPPDKHQEMSRTLEDAKETPTEPTVAVRHQEIGTISRRKRSRSLRFIKKFNSKMKAMVSLTALFFIFTLPLVIGLMVDLAASSPMPARNVFKTFADLCAFMYTLLCPIIVLKFMPRLKMSVTLCIYHCLRWCD